MIKRYYRQISPNEEICFNVGLSAPLTSEEESRLIALLGGPGLSEEPRVEGAIEIGPLLNFATSRSTNALSIFRICGLTKVTRMEESRRMIVPDGNVAGLFDRMTEGVYKEPFESFDLPSAVQPLEYVDLKEEGPEILARIPGISMDEADRNYYYDYFVNLEKRNATLTEIMDLNTSMSEHSRHGFFRAKQEIDGEIMPRSLMELIQRPLTYRRHNSIIAFRDNSSGIKGNLVCAMIPSIPGQPSKFTLEDIAYDIIFTAETHNFPTGISPFPGAETGTGGRIRDVQATGKGGLVIAGTAGYCVGDLHIPGYDLSWEGRGLVYPNTMATPLDILIEASNGASDYGNKFGEPLIQGFARSVCLNVNDERREYIKPIMFTGGIGQIDERHLYKHSPVKGMLIIQIGGPAYRIGLNGGAASSMLQGDNEEALDFNAVQRGDAEMEQKMNRVIRACSEMGEDNPILNLHDQGAGGPANVLKELVEEAGGTINIRNIKLGDPTMSVLEIYCAEYQERNALLLDPSRLQEFKAICERERVNCEVLGKVTGDKRFVVHDPENPDTPIVDFNLKVLLSRRVEKTFTDTTIPAKLRSLILPLGFTLELGLEKVLKLFSVGSKRHLINKVDRSVTGLVAQQQGCGRLHLPVGNVAVVSQSLFETGGVYPGAATAIGEQPLKILVDPAAGARMSIAEAMTNLVFARITNLDDVKCSVNWMGAPKLPGEGSIFYKAAQSASECMVDLGIAADGGKDSLSMATKITSFDGTSEIVKSPLHLVISAYCGMDDITQVITPDIKAPGRSKLLRIDLALGKRRLGGSALAQVFSQIGDESPDLESPALIKNLFVVMREFMDENLVLAGHDISDGGFITTVLEMMFAGNCGGSLQLDCGDEEIIAELFAEEAGIVIEYLPEDEWQIMSKLEAMDLPYNIIGHTTENMNITITTEEDISFRHKIEVLRNIWESTSFELEKLFRTPVCAEEEKRTIFNRSGPLYSLSYEPELTSFEVLDTNAKPIAYVIREEGSNGDREMAAALISAGFEVFDIGMSDLLSGAVTLAEAKGIIFPGGFSYSDTLGAGVGWAAAIRYNDKVKGMFEEFYDREDTFSLGVCNGCQMMARLGVLAYKNIAPSDYPIFVKNKSGQFESRFTTVKILPSNSIFLKDMEGSILPVWTAHGEGRLQASEKTIAYLTDNNFAPIRYADDRGEATEHYPFNPNGSALGISALSDPTGRHLAWMLHPERAFLPWQLAWSPPEWQYFEAGPWLKFFQNAREWCEKNQ